MQSARVNNGGSPKSCGAWMLSGVRGSWCLLTVGLQHTSVYTQCEEGYGV